MEEFRKLDPITFIFNLVFKSLLTTPCNVLPLHLKQTFPPIIWIFTEGEGDGIKSRLPFKIFSTLHVIMGQLKRWGCFFLIFVMSKVNCVGRVAWNWKTLLASGTKINGFFRNYIILLITLSPRMIWLLMQKISWYVSVHHKWDQHLFEVT